MPCKRTERSPFRLSLVTVTSDMLKIRAASARVMASGFTGFRGVAPADCLSIRAGEPVRPQASRLGLDSMADKDRHIYDSVPGRRSSASKLAQHLGPLWSTTRVIEVLRLSDVSALKAAATKGEIRLLTTSDDVLVTPVRPREPTDV